MLSDLPRDLAEDVLIRLPMTSMRAVRFVCKKWNALSKGRSFTKKHLALAKAAREFLGVIVINYRVYLMSFNLHGIHNNNLHGIHNNNLHGIHNNLHGIHNSGGPSINHKGKLVSLTDSDISVVYHCDGLLLCIMEHSTSFVVWNPYCGQTRWFEPVSPNYMYSFAIGYESSKSCRSYKVLRFHSTTSGHVHYQLYYINSMGMTIPITIYPDWDIQFYARGVSLNGNTYWFAQDNCLGGEEEREPTADVGYQDFLLCFDFTKERFGPHLNLPFHSYIEDTVTLSSVRDEQLAVLFQREDTSHMEIWITTKIEPEAVSWNNKLFLAVDMEPLYGYQFVVTSGSFFVDEEKKIAVVFDYDGDTDTGSVAYMIGEDGYFKKMDFGEPSNMDSYPLMCSYVPSLVQIKPPARGGKRKKRGNKKSQIIEYL